MNSRVHEEVETLRRMVALYCAGHRHAESGLCEECGALLKYATAKTMACIHGEDKPTCRQCTTHCYNPAQGERIRAVMRYSGPRMAWRHPVWTVRHLFREWFRPDAPKRGEAE